MIDQLSPEFVAAYAHWLGVTDGEAYHLLKNEPLVDVTDEDVTAAGWEEAEHPRYPEGDERGGQFRSKDSEEPMDLGPPAALPGAGGDWGSERDPQWEGDPLVPEGADYGGEYYAPYVQSDAAWQGQTRPEMGYSIDPQMYREALGGGDLHDYQQRVEQEMQRVAEEGQLMIQTPYYGVMDEILNEGRFKSQFETASSGGVFHPEGRAVQERMFFGYPQDIPPYQRPIYGWLDHPDHYAESSTIPQYGNVTWQLKEGMRGRTSVSFVDSLSRPVIPGPIRNPGWRAMVPPGYVDSALIGGVSDLLDYGLFDGDVIETQYHGGVSLEDVERVRIKLDEYDQDNLDFEKLEEQMAVLKEGFGILTDVDDAAGNPVYRDSKYVSSE